jgi:hypothetical protein
MRAGAKAAAEAKRVARKAELWGGGGYMGCDSNKRQKRGKDIGEKS